MPRSSPYHALGRLPYGNDALSAAWLIQYDASAAYIDKCVSGTQVDRKIALRRVLSGQSAISKASRTPAALWRADLLFCREIPMTKLYVGNLPFTATEEAVRNLFAPHGTVEKLSLINDRDTGRPRGFGFVEMSSADAARAMQALNGKDFDGRSLKINEAQDKARTGGGGSRH